MKARVYTEGRNTIVDVAEEDGGLLFSAAFVEDEKGWKCEELITKKKDEKASVAVA